jgi:hypothetical protein
MAKTDETFEETQATNDAWTGMLAISLLALLLGCLFLFLDYNQYPTKEAPAVPKAPQVQQAPPAAPPGQAAPGQAAPAPGQAPPK